MKEIIVGLVVLAYVIPFAYMLIADVADVSKRLFGIYSRKVKPALILVTKSIID